MNETNGSLFILYKNYRNIIGRTTLSHLDLLEPLYLYVLHKIPYLLGRARENIWLNIERMTNSERVIRKYKNLEL